MFYITSIDRIELTKHRTIFVIESPVESRRNFNDFINKVGENINIDGNTYRLKGADWHLPMTNISVGEKIAVLVETD